MLKRLRTLLIIVSAAYPLALLALILMLRLVGESWWVTTVALYLPRLGFAIPLPFTLVATWRWAPRFLLIPQVGAIYLLLFPLMGLSLGTGRSSASDGPIRLVSYNIDSGTRGIPGIVAQVREFNPNIVLLQETSDGMLPELTTAFSGWHVDQHDQFFLASRFPIQTVHQPPPLVYAKGHGGAHYMAYVLDTPIGPIEVVNVHTTSPRDGLEELRGNGFREEIRSGRLLSGARREMLEFNAYRRQRQIEAATTAAHNSPYPVIIAGDTNLPGLSRVLGQAFHGLSDAFDTVGFGFGYTFPDKHPWMRIDRVFVDSRLRVLNFRVGHSRASDHFCVMAELGKRS
jgi:endonuclease/exonuclease/phosphatase (EEP) superfamily protein YafD